MQKIHFYSNMKEIMINYLNCKVFIHYGNNVLDLIYDDLNNKKCFQIIFIMYCINKNLMHHVNAMVFFEVLYKYHGT